MGFFIRHTVFIEFICGKKIQNPKKSYFFDFVIFFVFIAWTIRA